MAKGDVLVGFYKEHGKTKPITKSIVQLNRRKNIVGSHKFRDVGPKVDVTQRLENLLEKLSMLENQKQDLLIQKQMFEKAGKNTGAVDHQLSIQERMILRQKLLIKRLGRKEHG
jgi:hypothetical protein